MAHQMADLQHCPQCGVALDTDAPQGMCPECLLKQAMARPNPAPGAAPEVAATAAKSTGFTAPTPEEIAPHFPKMEVLELLGQGGMGAVYKARQTMLDRMVAIKILPGDVEHDPTFAERFQREARALAKLNHPQIVTIFDFGVPITCTRYLGRN